MRTLVVALGLIAFTACKTDKKTSPATGSGSGSSAGSAVASGSGSATPDTGSAGPGSADVVKPADLTLPKSDGTPPKATTAPLDKAKAEQLAKIDVPGFEKAVRNTDGPFDVRFTTPRPRLATTVTIAPCFDCTPIELAKWQAKEPTMRQQLLQELADKPNTKWELGQVDVNGTPVIFSFQFAHFFGKDEQGNPQGGFSNAYALYWNDGKNQIRVVAEYKDDPAAPEDIVAMAPREDLEKLARAFFDLYVHNW